MCSFVLAAHFWLEKQGLEKNAPHSFIEEAFSKYAQFWTKLGTRLGLFFAKNKLSMIANEAERKSKSYYGGSFQIISEGDREKFYSSNVLRCGHFEFFKTHGRPEVKKALCKWDCNWADENSSPFGKVVAPLYPLRDCVVVKPLSH